MKLHFLFPSNPLRAREIDPMFADQAAALSDYGVTAATCEDDRWRGVVSPNSEVVYRGWMLHYQEYAGLVTLIESQNSVPLTSMGQYLRCHYLPNWISAVREFTAETLVIMDQGDSTLSVNASKVANLAGWDKFFIKDFVKSLKTSVGSVVTHPDEIPQVLAEMQKYRGKIEGGICLRRYEILEEETRYFVLRGIPYVADYKAVPDVVKIAAERIKSPFFSVDVATRDDGEIRIVEIGDGQVSDTTGGWTPDRFAEIWRL